MIMIDVAEYMNELASKLQDLGSAQLVYATAELAPFSSQFKPDIVFSPMLGGYKGQTFFIDYIPTPKFPSRSMVKDFSDRKIFAEEYIERSISRYVVLFELTLDDFSEKSLRSKNITTIHYPISSTLFRERIRSIMSES